MLVLLYQRFPNAVIELYDYQEKHLDGLPNYHQINVLSSTSVSTIDFDSDLIFLFTGKTGTTEGFENPLQYIDINEKSLLNLLTEYIKNNSKAKIVFPSTRLVYKGKGVPLKEDSEKEFKTIYSMNKYSCENYLKQYSLVFNVKYVIFRICVPYGSLIEGASSYGTCEYMLKRAKDGQAISLYGDGTQRRTFTHIEDLCNIIIDASMDDNCSQDVFNIGGESYSLLEVASLIDRRYHNGIVFTEWPKKQFLIESGDTVFDDTKLKKILNCKYKTSFADWINRN